MSRDYELPVLPRATERERLESPLVATTTATAISSDDDDGLFTEGESKAEIDEEDSDPSDAGDETTSEDRMPQWKVDHSSGDHKLQGKLAGREGWQEETDDV